MRLTAYHHSAVIEFDSRRSSNGCCGARPSAGTLEDTPHPIEQIPVEVLAATLREFFGASTE